MTGPGKRPSVSKRRADAEQAEIKKLAEQLQAWTVPEGAIDRVHDAARASFAEVKALTEYEDGKASRLMTVVAFLSAVVAAVFTRFATDYSWPGLSEMGLTPGWLLPAATYATFLIYVLLVTWSVFRILDAIRPSFNLPSSWKEAAASRQQPESMLFYRGILGVTASDWGGNFAAMAGEDGQALKASYAKNYVMEAYLIAGKVAIKLAALEPGIRHLRWAMGVLLVFFGLFGATLLAVEPTRVPVVHASHASVTGGS